MHTPATTTSTTPAMPEYLGLAALMRLTFSGADLTQLYQQMIQRATDDPDDAAALLDAAIILQFHRKTDLALQLQREALKVRRHYRLATRQPPRLRLLALMAPGAIMENVPIECLLENADIELNVYFAVEGNVDLTDIPEHDVLFVAIGESEANRPLLAAWRPVLEKWPRPVINDPYHIERVARDTASHLLGALPGIIMPPTRRVSSATLAGIASAQGVDGVTFPFLLRPLDSHAGHDLYRIDTHDALRDRLAMMSGDEFFVSPFIDYRSNDGLFRKYRVILIDGQPFPCHMAISAHWMIHYLNAGMAESTEKRAEEARFMVHFEDEFAVRHQHALAGIHQRIGLDYLGIDCAETADGRLLVFEVDPAMVVHALDPVETFPYKQAPMENLFAAFRTMLARKAASPHHS